MEATGWAWCTGRTTCDVALKVMARIGLRPKGRGAAKKAYELSAGLSREERLLMEGRYREATREWEKAEEIYQSLFRFFPDDLDYGLLLAGVQTQQGKPRDALETVASMRKLPAPLRDDHGLIWPRPTRGELRETTAEC